LEQQLSNHVAPNEAAPQPQNLELNSLGRKQCTVNEEGFTAVEESLVRKNNFQELMDETLVKAAPIVQRMLQKRQQQRWRRERQVLHQAHVHENMSANMACSNKRRVACHVFYNSIGDSKSAEGKTSVLPELGHAF